MNSKINMKLKSDICYRKYRFKTSLSTLLALISIIGINANSFSSNEVLGLSHFTTLTYEEIQQSEIKGTVLDEAGAPLPGCSIIIKGTQIGTDTDFNGNFSINANENDILVISYLGYLTKEIQVGKQTNIKVSLSLDVSNLDEVVVVGFGTKKKANVTGATSSVDMGDILANRPVTNTLQAIQGTVPGLQITSNSGQPGEQGLGFNIRGTTSINGGSPLVLVNNVPVSIEDVNPQDVESVTVLKDAAASSIYGARAAFGVILITTKKGVKNQSIKLNYSSTFSFSTPEDIPEKASTYDFIHALNDWGTNPFFTGQDIPTWIGFLEENKTNPNQYPNGYAEYNGLRYPLVDTDLIGAFLNNSGVTQIHNVNFSGGTAKSSYRVSAGFSDEDGIIVTDNDSYKKYNLNANLNTELTSKLNSSTSIFYRNSERSDAIGSFQDAIRFNPYTPADGNHVFDDGREVPYQTPANMERLGVAPVTLTDNIRLFQKLDFTPIKDLTITGEYTFEKGNTDVISGNNQVLTVNPDRFVINPVNPENTFYRKQNSKFIYNALNIYAKYNKSIGDHNITVLGGMNKENRENEWMWAKKTNLISVDLPSLSGATGDLTGDDGFGEWSVMGYFGRLNYNYKDKYMLEVNGRYDGSSRFPEDDRFGFFPSFSTGWNVTEEKFMENINVISLLKVRASWGTIGNQNTSSLYPAIPGMGVQNASWINPNTGFRYVSLGLPPLVSSSFTWEEVQTTNFGLDARLLNSRLTTSFDIYTRKTLDMLAPGAELPAVLGASAPYQNVADLESKGWELEISWKDKVNDFSYNVGFTLSDGKSKVTKFDNPAGLLSQYYIGRNFGEIWGYVTDGYYTVDDFVEGTLNENLTGGTLKDGIPAYKGRNPNPGDVKFKDLNDDGEIFSGNNTLEDPGDRKIIGNSTRRYQYGIFGNASYKNFDLSFLLNGVGKRDVYNSTAMRFPYTHEFGVVYKHQLDYWTPENTDAFFPRNYALGGVNYGLNRTTQTKYLLDGSYLRIKNITLGYNMPSSILEKVKIDRLRFYVAGENLLSFDNLPDGINTELTDKGDGGTYPYLRSFSVGLNLTF